MGGCLIGFSTIPPLVRKTFAGPVPVAASWASGPDEWVIQFDQAVTIVDSDASDFSGRSEGYLVSGGNMNSVSADTIRVNGTFGTSDVGPDVVSYASILGHLEDAFGNSVAAFVDFPVTI